ncbi:MAG: prepilin-type N-terminal cleavage/methylation domain-containing protein, partial [Eubacterium sp.]|nr:prepilin-type N-terminal cleavage/methylation domain-containing protein [Eubacterium sp.]
MKKTNKGFSLVELIIVIAIMAILAAAIAPALIRYIDKSRRADDVTAAGTVLTGVQTAMADEDCYSEIQA